MYQDKQNLPETLSKVEKKSPSTLILLKKKSLTSILVDSNEIKLTFRLTWDLMRGRLSDDGID